VFSARHRPFHDQHCHLFTANSRSVNVIHGETVKFVSAYTGASFVWPFYTPATAFELGDVVTTGFMEGRRVGVLVDDDFLQNWEFKHSQGSACVLVIFGLWQCVITLPLRISLRNACRRSVQVCASSSSFSGDKLNTLVGLLINAMQ
jgi:hypothetical protein